MAYHSNKSVCKGVYHDLNQIFDKLNAQYFDNHIQAEIKWGRFGSFRGRKRSIRLGSYCRRRQAITIHPALDQAQVPSVCVARVVHHEMLHQQFPATKDLRGRRSIHSPEFKKHEAKFEHARHADDWFKQNLHQLLS